MDLFVMGEVGRKRDEKLSLLELPVRERPDEDRDEHDPRNAGHGHDDGLQCEQDDEEVSGVRPFLQYARHGRDDDGNAAENFRDGIEVHRIDRILELSEYFCDFFSLDEVHDPRADHQEQEQ